MSMRKRNKRLLVALVVLLFIIGISTYATIHTLFFKPINGQLSQSRFLYIDQDDNIDSVEQKIVKTFDIKELPKGFSILNNYKSYSQNIRTGKYKITPDETTYTLFVKLLRGHQIPTRLVINNIRTLDQLSAKLGDQLMLGSLEFQFYFKNEDALAKIGYTPETLPAFFIPNTYEVYWNMDMNDFIGRMSKEYNTFWNEERLKKAQKIGLTPIQVATLASIVEEETNDKEEKPVVAGLYMNRLKKGMPLQADPTIKFALQDFAMKRITNKDLTVNSPYNTYLNTGLPPGPIRLATIHGLESVLNYTEHNYLYMCAKEDFSGKHSFATNLNDHMNNARRYWQALNKLKIYK
jgi:UPF0755 protein